MGMTEQDDRALRLQCLGLAAAHCADNTLPDALVARATKYEAYVREGWANEKPANERLD